MMDSKKRVLVIDDDSDFRAAVAALLQAEGYEVAEATSGRDGLAALPAVHPDVVVLDVMMEDAFAGYGVNQAIRFQPGFEEFQHLPIVMVSSVQESPDERFLKAAGEAGMVRPDAYLTKPLDAPRFLQTVRRLASPPTRRG
jgi:CheY-like chemotaxis protein